MYRNHFLMKSFFTALLLGQINYSMENKNTGFTPSISTKGTPNEESLIVDSSHVLAASQFFLVLNKEGKPIVVDAFQYSDNEFSLEKKSDETILPEKSNKSSAQASPLELDSSNALLAFGKTEEKEESDEEEGLGLFDFGSANDSGVGPLTLDLKKVKKNSPKGMHFLSICSN